MMTGLSLPQHHVVYVPGLGDTAVRGQRLALRLWRTYGYYGHCHPVVWNNNESFDGKLEGVLKAVDELLTEGYTVSLMGASAGASMVLHAYALRKDKLAGVVLVCGELGEIKAIKPAYFEKNPAFKTSMERLPETLRQLTPEDRLRVMSIHPLFDETVPIKDTQLDGARMFTTISFGHAFTIGLTLTVDCYIPLWFLSKWARQRR
jgi:pimeloyl-ACP methyl ester carboxylesterase